MWTIKARHVRDADGGTAALELETEDRRLDVNVRWDGCMELHVYSVTEENRELHDTFHTCDLVGFIEALHSLNEVCRHYFDKGSYWERDPDDEDRATDKLDAEISYQ
ncbi:hypothetical protein E5161_00955 [Cohnella pontilimi]|uniref:Uncharacterized protein n=1 Tax=Cohnella pontilimi TaxID=2564100 RepID=A0A4U0FGH9_9BACL|nr:hypothetical protein [Cohnella pontilimi]TJY43998.1 hypothetical protein E5161_00955 [Cohnella pontilimi]